MDSISLLDFVRACNNPIIKGKTKNTKEFDSLSKFDIFI